MCFCYWPCEYVLLGQCWYLRYNFCMDFSDAHLNHILFCSQDDVPWQEFIRHKFGYTPDDPKQEFALFGDIIEDPVWSEPNLAGTQDFWHFPYAVDTNYYRHAITFFFHGDDGFRCLRVYNDEAVAQRANAYLSELKTAYETQA